MRTTRNQHTTMAQRLLALLLTVVIAVGMLPLSGLAADATGTADATTTADTSVTGITMALDFTEIPDRTLTFVGGTIDPTGPEVTGGINGALFGGAYILIGGDTSLYYELNSLETINGKVYYTTKLQAEAVTDGKVLVKSVKADDDKIVFSYFSQEGERHNITYTINAINLTDTAYRSAIGTTTVTKEAKTVMDGQTVYFQVQRPAGMTLSVQSNNGTVEPYNTAEYNQDGVFLDTYKLYKTSDGNTPIEITITEGWRYTNYGLSFTTSTPAVISTDRTKGTFRVSGLRVNGTVVGGGTNQGNDGKNWILVSAAGKTNAQIKAASTSSYTVSRPDNYKLAKVELLSVGNTIMQQYNTNTWDQRLVTFKVNGEAVSIPIGVYAGSGNSSNPKPVTTVLKNGEAYGTKVTVSMVDRELRYDGASYVYRYTVTFENVHCPLSVEAVYAPLGTQSVMWMVSNPGVDVQLYLKPDWSGVPNVADWWDFAVGAYYYGKNNPSGQQGYLLRWKHKQGYYNSSVSSTRVGDTATATYYSKYLTVRTNGYYDSYTVDLTGTTTPVVVNFTADLLTYKVTYDANGGAYLAQTGGAPVDNNSYDAAMRRKIVIDQKRPTRTGYIFLGYKIEGEKTGRLFQPGDLNDIVDLTNTSQVDLSGLSNTNGVVTLKFVAQWKTVDVSTDVSHVKVQLNMRNETGSQQTSAYSIVVAPESDYEVTKYPTGIKKDGTYVYTTIANADRYDYEWILKSKDTLTGTVGEADTETTVNLTYEHPAKVTYSVDVASDYKTNHYNPGDYLNYTALHNAFDSITLSGVKLTLRATAGTTTTESTDPDTGAAVTTTTVTKSDGTVVETVTKVTTISSNTDSTTNQDAGTDVAVQSDEPDAGTDVAVQSDEPDAGTDVAVQSDEPDAGTDVAVQSDEPDAASEAGIMTLGLSDPDEGGDGIAVLAGGDGQAVPADDEADTTTPSTGQTIGDAVLTNVVTTTTKTEHVGWVDTQTNTDYAFNAKVKTPWDGLTLQARWKTTSTTVENNEVTQLEAENVVLSYWEAYNLLEDLGNKSDAEKNQALVQLAKAVGYRWTATVDADGTVNTTRPDPFNGTTLSALMTEGFILTSTEALPTDGGQCQVTIAESTGDGVTRKTNGASVTVTFTVEPRNDTELRPSITASDFTLYASQVQQVLNGGPVTWMYPDQPNQETELQEFLIARAKADAWVEGDTENKLTFAPATLSANFSTTPGVYPITFHTEQKEVPATEEGAPNVIVPASSKIVNVTVKADPTTESIQASDITLTYREALDMMQAGTTDTVLRDKGDPSGTSTNQVTGVSTAIPKDDIAVSHEIPETVQAGTYTVTFTTPNGTSVVKKVTIASEPTHAVTQANDFSLTLAEAETIEAAVKANKLNDPDLWQLLKDRAKATGYVVGDDTGETKETLTLVDVVYKNVKAEPGQSYDVEFVWSDSAGNRTTSTTKATVLNENLQASDFQLTLEQAKRIADGTETNPANILKQAAGAKATAKQTDGSDKEIAVNVEQNIQAVPGGVYPVTFRTDSGAEVTVNATVLPEEVYANNITLSTEEARSVVEGTVDAAAVLTNAANATAIGEQPDGTWNNIPIAKVDHTIQLEPGDYEVTFTTAAGTTKTVTVTVTPDATTDPTPESTHVETEAKNVSLTLDEAKTIETAVNEGKLDVPDLKELLKGRANPIGRVVGDVSGQTKEYLELLDVVYKNVKAQPGSYDVEFVWKDSAGNQTTSTTKATVLNEDIQASPFKLTLEQAKRIADGTETDVAALLTDAAGAKATAKQTDGSETALTMTVTQNIQPEAGKVYPVTFRTANGAEVTVNATVLSEEVKASDFSLSTEEASGVVNGTVDAAELLKQKASATATGEQPDGNWTDITITKVEHNIQQTPGEYEVTFTTAAGTTKTAKVTVTPDTTTTTPGTTTPDTTTPDTTTPVETPTEPVTPDTTTPSETPLVPATPADPEVEVTVETPSTNSTPTATPAPAIRVTKPSANTPAVIEEPEEEAETPDAPADAVTEPANSSKEKTPLPADATAMVTSFPTPVWALCNLVLTILVCLIGVVLLLVCKNKDSRWIRFASVLLAVASVITFLLTEDLANTMTLVDRWTLLMAAFALVQIVLVILARKNQTEDETQA